MKDILGQNKINHKTQVKFETTIILEMKVTVVKMKTYQ